MGSLDILPASGTSGMTPLTTWLTAHFNIIPISPREELLSVPGLVHFMTMLSGQLTWEGDGGLLSVPTWPQHCPCIPTWHWSMALTLECRIFNSSGVSSAQLDKATRSERSLTGGISPWDIAPKYLQEKSLFIDSTICRDILACDELNWYCLGNTLWSFFALKCSGS